MQFHKFKFSSVASVAFNEKAKEMTVIFKNNAMYRYNNVTKEEYEKILTADSPGTKLKEIVKGKTYTKL